MSEAKPDLASIIVRRAGIKHAGPDKHDTAIGIRRSLAMCFEVRAQLHLLTNLFIPCVLLLEINIRLSLAPALGRNVNLRRCVIHGWPVSLEFPWPPDH